MKNSEKFTTAGPACSSVAEPLPSMPEALGSIPSSEKKKKRNKWGGCECSKIEKEKDTERKEKGI